MSGGAIRNCHSHGNGGGIDVIGKGVQIDLSGVTVQGCTAEVGGGMYLEENTDARLIDVRIEDCEALAVHCCAYGRGGGGISMNQGSTLRAERVHVARCRALLTKGTSTHNVQTRGQRVWTERAPKYSEGPQGAEARTASDPVDPVGLRTANRRGVQSGSTST